MPISPSTSDKPDDNATRTVRVLAVATGLFLVLLWAFVSYWAVSSRQERVDAAEQVLQRMNHAVEEQTRRLFMMVEIFLGTADQWVLDHPGIDPATDRRFLRLVENFRSRTGGAIDVHLADEQGRILALSTGGNVPKAAIGDADYFRAAMAGDSTRLHIGSPMQGGVNAIWQIPVAHRLAQRSKSAAALVAAIELPSLLGLYEEERMRPNGAIVLLRRDGLVLARAPHDDRLMGKSLVGGQLYREFLPRREHGFAKLDRTATDSMEKFISYSVMSDFPLLTVVSASVDDTLSGWQRQTQIIFLLTLAISIAGVLVALRLARVLTELSARTAELHHLATTDHLTGANNRQHFLSLLYHEFARGRRYKAPLSLLVLDLDFFKQINDGYGHAAGDAALCAFASAAQDCLRGMDALGRLGGEEFGILLPSAAADQAEMVAERIRGAVAGIAIDTEYGTVRFTTSIGVTQSQESDESVDVLLARADAALYAAKAAGRNRVVVRCA